MCGIFGIYGHPEASNLTYLGLHALQHRGQESAGISASDGEVVRTYRGMGLVVDVFDQSSSHKPEPNAISKIARKLTILIVGNPLNQRYVWRIGIIGQANLFSRQASNGRTTIA